MVASKEEKRAANAAAQRRRRVRQLFGVPPVGRGRKWGGGLTGWPASEQQRVDPGIGDGNVNFAWSQGQGGVPVYLPYTSAMVQTQLWYQHLCAGIHIMQQEQLREKTEALQGSRAELVRTEAELQTVREELAVKDAMLATATEAALADASTHREQNETLQARLERCQAQLGKAQEKARARKCRLREARDLLQQQELEVSREREDGVKWRKVQKAALKDLPDLASVNDGFDREMRKKGNLDAGSGEAAAVAAASEVSAAARGEQVPVDVAMEEVADVREHAPGAQQATNEVEPPSAAARVWGNKPRAVMQAGAAAVVTPRPTPPAAFERGVATFEFGMGRLDVQAAVDHSPDLAPSEECVICMGARRTTAMDPCGHYCVCDGCAASCLAAGGERNCPLCRGFVEKTLRIYL